MPTKLNLEESVAFSQFINTVKTPVYWKDKEGRCLGCNPYLLTILGLTNHEQIIGKTDEELWEPTENSCAWIESDRLALEHGLSEVDVVKSVSGEKRFFSIVKTRWTEESEKVVGILGFFTETTKQMPEAEALKLETLKKINVLKHLELLARLFPVPVYWYDLNSRFIGANEHTLAGAGVTSFNDLLGKTLYDVYPKEIAEHIAIHNEEVIRSGQTLSQEEPIKDISSGRMRYYDAFKAPLRDEDGEVIGTLAISIETTAEKEAEKLKQENERQQAALRENFARTVRKVAHDINSPIAALHMMLDVCNELPEDKRTFLRRATESILDIANNLLSNDEKEENLNDTELEFREPLLVSDLLIHLLSEKKVQYQEYPVTFETVIAHDAQFAFIQMQKTELRRALSNLINNAVDALEDGAITDGTVTVQLSADADFVIVKVQDNGKGMPRDKVEKILSRQSFTEGKENGHGIGLQQVGDMLECNHGTMTVQSRPGKGTTIQLTFPRIAASDWIAQEIHLSKDTIIVILDDDESVRQVSRRNNYFALKRDDKVRCAVNGSLLTQARRVTAWSEAVGTT